LQNEEFLFFPSYFAQWSKRLTIAASFSTPSADLALPSTPGAAF
jgi:hypothetical protein